MSHYEAAFTTSSPTGGLSDMAGSQITITFPARRTDTPAGWEHVGGYVTVNNTAMGNCSERPRRYLHPV